MKPFFYEDIENWNEINEIVEFKCWINQIRRHNPNAY